MIPKELNSNSKKLSKHTKFLRIPNKKISMINMVKKVLSNMDKVVAVVVIISKVVLTIFSVNSSEVVAEEAVIIKNSTSVVVVEDNSNSNKEISLVRVMFMKLKWVVYPSSSVVKKFGLFCSTNPISNNPCNWRIAIKNWPALIMVSSRSLQLTVLKKMLFVKMNFKPLNILPFKFSNLISVLKATNIQDLLMIIKRLLSLQLDSWNLMSVI